MHASWVDRDRFGPAKNKTSRYRQAEERQDDSSEWIDVSQRIHGEPTLYFGGRVAASKGNPTMGVFMQYHCEEERERRIGKCMQDLR
jgi:hypothetical protein